MKKAYRKILVLALAIIALAMTPGCQEERVVDPKSCPAKYRLLAHEKRGLETQISTLQSEHKKEIKKQGKLLAQCQRDREAIGKMTSKGVGDQINTALVEKISIQLISLREENEILKVKIAQLEKELEELRKTPAVPDKPQPL
ncbi:MAG: hypothetical protein ACYSX1_09640 [Planctomycetota bacterium]|jgi:hypothetical protein